MSLILLGLLGSTAGAESIGSRVQTPITRVAFGSCLRGTGETAWRNLQAHRPEVLILLGDNMYADRPTPPKSPGDIAAKYRQRTASPGFQKAMIKSRLIATWDDHDYGLNDAGKEFPWKRQSQMLMLSTFSEPADSPRWSRKGVYGAWLFGPQDQRLQVILLDTRYHRDPLRKKPAGKPAGRGPYAPHPADHPGTLLGEAQWKWLREQLNEPAQIRIIGSSIQVLSGEHGFECWSNFPAEQQRLFDLIKQQQAEGVIFLSGDRHHAEVSKRQEPDDPYPYWDITSSGLDSSRKSVSEPNRYRVGDPACAVNSGYLAINWQAGPEVTFTAYGDQLETLWEQKIDVATLKAATASTP